VPAHISQHNYNRHNVRNNTRPAVSHNAHDGQHLLPAIGGDDDDWPRPRYIAQQFTISVRGDTIARSRLLHKVGLDFGESLEESRLMLQQLDILLA
jgi:hypothetical protein